MADCRSGKRRDFDEGAREDLSNSRRPARSQPCLANGYEGNDIRESFSRISFELQLSIDEPGTTSE